MRLAGSLLLALGLCFASNRPVAAQDSVGGADIQRLQDAIYDTARDVSQLRDRDAALASRLQNELDDARDETIYLKVKLRKNQTVTRADFVDLRNRIDNIRARARGESTPPPPVPLPAPIEQPRETARASESRDIPVGTEFDVRLQQTLSSATAQVEDRFEATTLVDLMDGDRVIVPAGSVMRGMVSSVNKATRLDRKGSMTAVFDRVTVRGRAFPIRATVEQTLESEGVRGEAGKIGAGAGVGAILGAILGGAKGALAGILVGGGGVMAATDGKDVELPAGTVLRVRLDSGLNLR